MMIFFALLISPLWGMEKTETNKNWFITALNYRMNSRDPIVLCFQHVNDDISEIAMLKTVRKGIQSVVKADINAMTSPLRQSLEIGLSDETKKAYADEINNGWIALCVNVPYSKVDG